MQLLAELLPHQVIGKQWVLEHEDGGCILSDDMGLGKTITTIATLCQVKVKTLIVVPLALIHQWNAEIAKHSYGFQVCLYIGTPKTRKKMLYTGELEDSDIVITTYGSILRDFKSADWQAPSGYIRAGFKRIVVDEAHKLKNSESKSCEAIKILLKQLDITKRIFLTGTPICNKKDDLETLFSLTTHYPKKKFNTTEDLNEAASIHVLRRTKEQVLQSLLPNIIIQDIARPIEKESSQDKFYSWIDDNAGLGVLVKMLRKRQCANDAKLIPFSVVEDMPSIEDIKYDEIGLKLFTLLSLLSKVPANEKIVIFSQWRSMLNIISRVLSIYQLKHSMYHGLLSTDERNKVIENWKKDLESRIILVSLKAGGYGLNLVEANHVIVVEPYWNYADEKQAIDRVYRIGQTKDVYVYKLWSKGTIEDYMRELQQEKKELAEEILGN
jgi:SNF2 family DNA or RNA helicase